MQLKIIPALSYRLVYPFVMSLAAELGEQRKTITVVDFTEGSAISSQIRIAGLYSEMVRNKSLLYYINLPIKSYEEINTMVEMTYKNLMNTDVKVVLFPNKSEITSIMIAAETEIYKKYFGGEPVNIILIAGMDMVIASNTAESPFIGLDRSKTYVALLYEKWQEDLIPAYDAKVTELVNSGGYRGHSYVLVDPAEVPSSFTKIKKYNGVSEIIVELFKPAEKLEKAQGTEQLDLVVKESNIITLIGSAFSKRNEILKEIIDGTDHTTFILNAGNLNPQPGSRELKLAPSFSDERFKAKNIADVKGISKRLAEEVIKNAKIQENILIVVYETGNITPGVVGFDPRTVAHEFWDSFITHLKYNIKGLKVVFACDPAIEHCEALESLSDAVVSCENQQEISIKKRQ
ncbi:MAG: hypothetical protein ACP5TZ_00485 [Nitrososphaeria archaeon]